MMKMILLILIIVGMGLVTYDYVAEDAPSHKNEQIDTREVVNDVSPPTLSEMTTDNVVTKPFVNSEHTVDLSNNGLTKTPAYVFERTDTVKLDLSNNELTGSLQAEIRHLQDLKVLDLSNNQFTGVPAEIGQLTHLEVLDLSNNHVTGLPLELGNLTNLKVLNLRGNEYSKTDLAIIKEKLPPSTVIEVD